MKYAVEIELQKTPEVIFNHLTNLTQWWPEDFKGNAISPDSEFAFTTGDGHYSTNKIIDFLPGKKLAWQAITSLRKSDNFDWSGSKFIFDITPKGDTTTVKFTYDGVVFEHESDKLVRICDITLKEMFYNYITKNEG